MLAGEDFGYLKNDDEKKVARIIKRALLFGSVLFSIVCFIYITINAYYFVYQDKDSNIKVIKSPLEPIKIVEENQTSDIKDIDKTIYDNIVGNQKLVKEDFQNVKVIEQAPTPLVRPLVRPLVSPLVRQNNSTENFQINKSEIVVSNQSNKTSDSESKKESNKNQMVVYTKTIPDQTLDQADKKLKNNKDQKDNIKETAKKDERENMDEKIQNSTSIKRLSKVQIAALGSKSSAVEYWQKLRKAYPNLLGNLNYFISEVNLGQKGVFYRLQIGNFRSQIDAEQFCQKFILQLEKTRANCVIVE